MRPRTLRIGIAVVTLAVAAPLAAAQDLVVQAASSLTEAFTQEARAFETAHPGAHVLLNFAGSSTLSTQITQGAPADVFASADVAQMEVVARAGLLAGEPVTFTGNELVVVAASGTRITSPEDLARRGVRLVLAGPVVPVGAYSRLVLAKLDALYGAGFSERVLANVVSEELNVRLVAAKVELGEADAAIVYSTDAAVMQGVDVVQIPAEANINAAYQIAALKGARYPRLAQAFIEFVRSTKGQNILEQHGFTPPPGS